MTADPKAARAPVAAGKKGVDGAALAALVAVAAGVASERGVPLTPGGLKQTLREAIAKDPVDALAVTVLGGAWLFYLAEKGSNPKVTTYWDALVFISTSLSVGYADIFARTPAGQAIASALMTFGPALSGAALDAPAGDAAQAARSDHAVAIQQIIADKLDAILAELKAQRSGGRPGV